MDPILVTVGVNAAGMAVNEASKMAAGHWGYQVLDNVISVSTGQFGSFFGGRMIGPIIAGGAASDISDATDGVATALDAIGQTALLGAQHYLISGDHVEKIINADGSEVGGIIGYNTLENDDQKVNWGDAASTASKMLSAGAILVSAAGVAGAGITLPLGIAFLRAAPGLIDTLRNPSSQKEVDFVDDIIKKIAIDFVATATGTMAGNITKYKVVKNAYDNTIKSGESVAMGVNFLLPEALHETTKKIGAFVGWLFAGKTAMSKETIEEANRMGIVVNRVVFNGVEGIGSVASTIGKTSTNDNNSAWEIARKAAWVACGGVGVGALMLVAPEAAFLAGATAALGVTNKIAAYALQKLATKQPDEAQTLATSQLDEVQALETSLPDEAQTLATSQPEVSVTEAPLQETTAA